MKYEFIQVLLNAVMILCFCLGVILIMSGELEVGLIAIAVGIAVGLSPIWYILRGERRIIRNIQTQITGALQNIQNRVDITDGRLREIVASGIDEKIGMLSIHVGTVEAWQTRQNITETGSRNTIERIKSDINALGKFSSSMSDSQRIGTHGALRRIVEILEEKGYQSEAGEIKDLSGILFSSSLHSG